MATEIEIQKCKKILFDEFGQNDKLDNFIDEYFEVVKKIIGPRCNSPSEFIDEIAAFYRHKISPEYMGYLKKEIPNLDLDNLTSEEAFKKGLRLSQEFSVKA